MTPAERYYSSLTEGKMHRRLATLKRWREHLRTAIKNNEVEAQSLKRELIKRGCRVFPPIQENGK